MKKFLQTFVKPFLTALGTVAASISLVAFQSQVTSYVQQWIKADTDEARNLVIASAIGAAIVGGCQIIVKAVGLWIEWYNTPNA